MYETESVRVRRLVPEEVGQVLSAGLGLARLVQGDGAYLVAWLGDDPVGHVYLVLTDPPELQDVSVRPEYRRRGIASALIGAAEREARARRFDRLRLGVSVDNGAAQALYRGLGVGDAGVPPERVQGTIVIRTGPIQVDDTLFIWEKLLGSP